MFDLPSTKKIHQKNYRRFIKSLKNNGYICVQESVYAKLLFNISTSEAEIKKISLPPEGDVRVLTLSLNSFKKMKALLGDNFNFHIFSDDFVVFE